MENGNDIEKAKYAVLALLSMRAANSKYFNGTKDMGKAAIKLELTGSKISVPDETSRTKVKRVPNPYHVTIPEVDAAMNALIAENCKYVAMLPDRNYVITEAGEKELAAMQKKIEANGTATPTQAVGRVAG